MCIHTVFMRLKTYFCCRLILLRNHQDPHRGVLVVPYIHQMYFSFFVLLQTELGNVMKCNTCVYIMIDYWILC